MRTGGTLRFVGRGDVDHLDPVCANYTATSALERAYTRQLVTCPSGNDITEAGRIVADLATEVPDLSNGRVTADGTTYRFTLRADACWDTTPPRPVTAYDVVRGIKRMCNPVAPAPLLSYFTTTIRGLREFRDGFRDCPRTVPEIAGHIERHDVDGVRAVDERTVVFTLTRPAPDFLNILTLPCASAAPAEYLEYLPDSPELTRNMPSNGPYRIAVHRPGAGLRLDRNPYWKATGDPVRGQYVDAIEVVQGLSQEEAARRVLDGSGDLLWDVPPPTAWLPELAGDPRLRIVAHGMLNPCLIINMVSPNAGHATGRREVRQAIRAALDKRAIAELYGGPALNDVTDRLLPAWSSAHAGPPDDTACGPDPAEARRLLAAAGYPDGLTLTMIHRDAGNHPAVAHAIRDSLARAGIDLVLRPVPLAGFYSDWLEIAEVARGGGWDIMAQGWLPDWQGNNARTYLQPHFYSAGLTREDTSWGAVYGFYQNPVVNGLIEQAAAAPDPVRADKLCHQAESQVLDDAAAIPVQFQKNPTLCSARVRGFTGYPSHIGDPTQIWLDG